jgi:anti-repressor protein
MKELIPISDHNGRKAVDARLLHAFLESKREFATWIKDRIRKYGFVENQDYVVFDEIVNNPSGGRPLTEYALTLDCAKELSMVEGNAKGKQARQYFIACEQELRQITAPQSEDELLLMAMNTLAKRVETQKVQLRLAENTIREQAPKVEYHDRVLQSDGLIATNVIAKELGMSAVMLNRKLHEMGIIYNSAGTWVLYHKYQDKGYTDTKTTPYLDSLGRERTSIHTYWTERGRKFIHELLTIEVVTYQPANKYEKEFYN